MREEAEATNHKPLQRKQTSEQWKLLSINIVLYYNIVYNIILYNNRGEVLQEDITILDVFDEPNKKTSKYMRQN